ncbi:MAG: dTDP-4-dehydrorhamnose 3,5-epimerase [Oceanicoccus sp.]
MNVRKTKIPGLILIEPSVFGDERGYFLETYNEQRYRNLGVEESFVQDNISFSRRGILRGLHYQKPMMQGKLVQVLQGEVFDVAVDVRHGSPTFGQWEGFSLSETNKHQFYVPPGFAHGFVVTSETALFSYKCTDLYNPDGEHSIAWNDPDINVQWPESRPQLSDKDQQGRLLRDMTREELPDYG